MTAVGLEPYNVVVGLPPMLFLQVGSPTLSGLTCEDL